MTPLLEIRLKRLNTDLMIKPSRLSRVSQVIPGKEQLFQNHIATMQLKSPMFPIIRKSVGNQEFIVFEQAEEAMGALAKRKLACPCHVANILHSVTKVRFRCCLS